MVQPTVNTEESPLSGDFLPDDQVDKTLHDFTHLDPRHGRAIQLLAMGKGVAETAKELRVSRQSIYLWLAKPQVKHELLKLRAETLTTFRDGYLAMGSLAVETLKGLLSSKEERIRLGAVKVWVDGLKFLVNAPLASEEPIDVPPDNSRAWLTDDLSKITPEQAQALLDKYGDQK